MEELESSGLLQEENEGVESASAYETLSGIPYQPNGEQGGYSICIRFDTSVL